MRALITICILFIFGSAFAQQFNTEVVVPELMEKLEQNPEEHIPFYVLLKDRVDVLAMKDDFKARKVTKDQRSLELITALQAKVDATQGPILDYLKSSPHVKPGSVQSYYITNMVYAEGTAQVISEISRWNEVELIEPEYDQKVGKIEIDECAPPPSLNGREPGHTAIKANKLWERGYTGYGTLVMIVDSGTDGDHFSLRHNWLGFFADGQGYTGSGDIPIDCIDNSDPQNPSDGHGSHVTGTVCGLNRKNRDTIGVAHGALWISSPSTGLSPCGEALLNGNQAFQYALNPDGNAATSSDVPIVINNSWGSLNGGCFNNSSVVSILNTLETAGIATVWSAGNNGPSAGTVDSESAINNGLVNTFSIGSVVGTNPAFPISGFSSRGPSNCPGTGSILIKPEVSAPGQNVRSCNSGGGFQSISGTSMASPQVSGAIAVLSEAFPDAIGEDLKFALYNSCTDLGVAGEDNTYGMGIIDMEAAYDYLVLEGFTPFDPAVANDVIGVQLDFDKENCGGVINGNVIFDNGGTNNLTSASIAYEIIIGGSVAQTGNWFWNGNLAQNERAEFTIPETAAPDGTYQIVVELSNPNNTADDHPLNNKLWQEISVSGADAVVPEIIGEVNPCQGSNALLSVDIPGASVIEWYLLPQSSIPAGTGNTYLTPPFAGSYTFYVDAIIEKSVGLPELDPATGEYSLNAGGLIFDVLTDIKLKSVKVYVASPGPRIISLRDENNVQMNSITPFLNTVGEHVLDLNFDIPAGFDYRLVLNAGTALGHTNGASFPYTEAGTVSIKSSTDIINPIDDYLFFYDWDICHRFPCGRQPIEVNFDVPSLFPFAAFDATVNSAGEASFMNNSTNGETYFWDFGDGNTSVSENPFHTYATVGTYEVSLTTIGADGCGDTEIKNVVVDDISSISEAEALNQIAVFPNPTQSRVSVKYSFDETQLVNLSVVDILGQTLQRKEQQSYLNDQVEIDLNNYSEGIYYLVFEIEGTKVVKKIVKMD